MFSGTLCIPTIDILNTDVQKAIFKYTRGCMPELLSIIVC